MEAKSETDLEARCRLARECGQLEGQLNAAKAELASMRNALCPMPKGCADQFDIDWHGIPVRLNVFTEETEYERAWGVEVKEVIWADSVYVCGQLFQREEVFGSDAWDEWDKEASEYLTGQRESLAADARIDAWEAANA